MNDFSELTKIPLSEIGLMKHAISHLGWKKIFQKLGDALGLDLEVIERETSIGAFNRTSLESKLRTCATAAHVRVSAFNCTSSVGGNSDSRHLVAIRRSLGQQRILNRKSKYSEN